MSLTHPIWLLLLIPMLATCWAWPLPNKTLLSLRVMSLLLIVLALSGFALTLNSRAGTIVVVADRSDSMPSDSKAHQKEIIEALQKSMGPNDRLAVVSFGRHPALEQTPRTGQFSGFVSRVPKDGSDLAGAIDMGLSLIPLEHPGRLLLLTDGKWTGKHPFSLAAKASSRALPIDYQTMKRSNAGDTAIMRVDAPKQVQPGESFIFTSWLYAPIKQKVTYTLSRGNTVIAQGTRLLKSGSNRLLFRDKSSITGMHNYTLRIKPSGKDPVPENNSAEFIVSVQGNKPILHVGPHKMSGLPLLLQKANMKVTSLAPNEVNWSLSGLSSFSSVILENVPANKIGRAGMEHLAAWVKNTGAGLMMTGGRSSYGPGGYYRSPLEPVLPVSMELRKEHRKLSLAIVVALDRSCSMGAVTSTGETKMQLANIAAAQSVQMLSAIDEFGAIAVDSAPHTIVSLMPVKDKAAIRSRLLSIGSSGGGIYVYEALKRSVDMLRGARAKTKHIILFADTADAEQPGKYKTLLKECETLGITVTVIGLGEKMDKDVPFLTDVAKRGKGRLLITNRADDLPRLFAQDTFIVARSAFLDEITKVQWGAGLHQITQLTFAQPPPIGGYNLCYQRPKASLVSQTVDEYNAPFVSSWQVGLGRAVAYTGEIDGKYTGPFAKWDKLGSFVTSLTRWVAGGRDNLPNNMMLQQSLKNGVHKVTLFLDPERKGNPFQKRPRVRFLQGRLGSSPQVHTMQLRWETPDQLSASLAVSGDQVSMATVKLERRRPYTLAPVRLMYSPEYNPQSITRKRDVQQRLANVTGGKERLEVSNMWKDIPKNPRKWPLTPWLLSAAMMLLLFEILERRSSLLSSRWPSRQKTQDGSVMTVPTTAKHPITQRGDASTSVTKESTPQEEATPQITSALQQASKRARHRTNRDDTSKDD